MGRRPLPKRRSFSHASLTRVSLWGISQHFYWLSPSSGQVTYVLLTRSPLYSYVYRSVCTFAFDLHVLGTPPAFILSQDQTLRQFLSDRFATVCILLYSFLSDVRVSAFTDRTLDLGLAHSQTVV
jgi:hypothetical protein